MCVCGDAEEEHCGPHGECEGGMFHDCECLYYEPFWDPDFVERMSRNEAT